MINITLKSSGLGRLSQYKNMTRQAHKLMQGGLGTSFLSKKMGRYRHQAQKIVLDRVYHAYTPKRDNRTYNLLKAIHFNPISKDRFRLEVKLGPELRMVSPKGNTYYPMLVIKGVTSTYPVPGYPKRDFYYSQEGWLNHFKQNFGGDVYTTISQTLFL